MKIEKEEYYFFLKTLTVSLLGHEKPAKKFTIGLQ